MKKAIVMTLCAAMAVGMIGSVSTVYASEPDLSLIHIFALLLVPLWER